MNKVYVIDKDYLKKLYLIEEDIMLEEISDTYSIYNNIIKIYSKIELELDNNELYLPFRIILSDKTISHDMNKMYCKYLEKITKFDNISMVVEKKEDNNYAIFYSNSLVLYVKKYDMERLVTHLIKFNPNHIYYGQGKTQELKLREAGVNFKSQGEIHHGEDKLDKKCTKYLKEKHIISDKAIDKYLDLKYYNNYYQYNDLEALKNIKRIEHNIIPRHKVLKTDKFCLLKNIQEGGMIKGIEEYNEMLANNELPFVDTEMLKKLSENYYKQARKHNKKIFDNQEKAVCYFLNYKLAQKPALLVSENEQWIVYHQDNLENEDDEYDCRDKIIKILEEKNMDISNLKSFNLTKLANLFIHNNQLILSDKNNTIYLDDKGNNLPLHIIVNNALHHHGYYDNGIWEGIIKDEDYKAIFPEDLIYFTFAQIDNENHVEVSVNYDNRRIIIDDSFFLPAKYYDKMNKQLKKLFSYGLMTKTFTNIKWHKEKNIDIETVFMPKWIKNVAKDKEEELFKFLLQF